MKASQNASSIYFKNKELRSQVSFKKPESSLALAAAAMASTLDSPTQLLTRPS